jgi:MoaA/NifB/PqqE/SkfB family radical SAM enzyme
MMAKFTLKKNQDLFWSRTVSALIGVRFARLDVSSICQLRCPLCETGTGRNRKGPIGSGFVTADNFRKFLNLNPKVRWIELSNWGEIFLNPELAVILRIARQSCVQVSAFNGVNLNNASQDILEAVVQYRLRGMTLSIDGASQETYSIYRVGGDFSKVIENVRIINRYKQQNKTIFPILLWQFVMFGHNEHELGEARKMAQELGVWFYPKTNFDLGYSPLQNIDKVSTNLGKNLRTSNKFHQRWNKDNDTFCGQLWRTPQVNWDGKLLGCCMNVWGDYGNAFEKSLQSLMKAEPYAYAKAMLLGKKAPSKDIPCWHCNSFRRNARIDS